MKPDINSLKLAQWLSFLELFHFILFGIRQIVFPLLERN